MEIRVRPDGSLKVYGPVRILDVDDEPYDLAPWRKPDGVGKRVKLCRCGLSRTKPFCDESHLAGGFSSRPSVQDGFLPND